MTAVLVVDDETAILRVVGAGLRARGYDVLTAATGEAALESVARNNPDVVVLDLGLPDIDGLEVCRRLRGWSAVPIIVLSADGADDRKVQAFEEGADDYVTKPFSMPELATAESELQVGDLRIDLFRHRVTVAGRVVDLTPKEFDFLTLLARWPGRVLTHRTILQEVWGPEYGTETQYLRVYASQLRRKLADDPTRPRLVTEPGVGYRLVDVGDDEPA